MPFNRPPDLSETPSANCKLISFKKRPLFATEGPHRAGHFPRIISKGSPSSLSLTSFQAEQGFNFNCRHQRIEKEMKAAQLGHMKELTAVVQPKGNPSTNPQEPFRIGTARRYLEFGRLCCLPNRPLLRAHPDRFGGIFPSLEATTIHQPRCGCCRTWMDFQLMFIWCSYLRFFFAVPSM